MSKGLIIGVIFILLGIILANIGAIAGIVVLIESLINNKTGYLENNMFLYISPLLEIIVLIISVRIIRQILSFLKND